MTQIDGEIHRVHGLVRINIVKNEYTTQSNLQDSVQSLSSYQWYFSQN